MSVTIQALQHMKREGRKIVAVVVYDFQTAAIVDRAGVDLVSVGDSVGPTLWGMASEDDLTVHQMLLACTAVRRGASRALVSCDVPPRVVGEGIEAVIAAARRFVDEGGAAMVKLDAPLDVVSAVARTGLSVWPQFSGQGVAGPQQVEEYVALARALEAAGAAMLDFRHSGPVAGPAVARAVAIPVLGGLGGGPWLDGRVRAIGNAIGNVAKALDDQADRYANVARVTFDAITWFAEDVRAGRQVKGQ